MFTSRQVLHNASWIFICGILNAALSFLASAVISRKLNILDYGYLQYATTIFLFFQSLELLAHPSIIKKQFLNSPTKREYLIQSTSQIIVFSNLSICLFLIALWLIQGDRLYLFVFFMCLGQFFRVSNGISYCLDAELKSRATQTSQLFSNLIGGIYKIASSLISPVLYWQLLALPISYFINCLTHWKITNRTPRFQNLFKIHRTTLTIIKESLPLFLISIVTLAAYRIDIVILGYFKLTEQISLYSNAVKLAEPLGFLAGALVNSFFPTIIITRKKSIRLYYKKLRLLFCMLFWLGFGTAVLTTMLSDQIVAIIFGTKYQLTANILRVHIWSNIFLFLVISQHIWEISEGMNKFAFKKICFCVIFNVGINFLLIPKLGGMACAIASVSTYFLLSVGLNTLHKKARFLNKQIFISVFEIVDIVRIIFKSVKTLL